MPDSDVIVWGGELTVSNLINAYRRGIFPWPYDPDKPVPWCSPDPRAILRFADLHISRSLARTLRRQRWRVSINEAFSEVILSCSHIRRRPELGTWIFDNMVAAYERLHAVGCAHSVEVWDGDSLVGGLYGVSVDGLFSGESMFHVQPDASKVALVSLVRHLQAQGGEWVDIQELSPHLKQFGAVQMTRDAYLELLEETRSRKLDLFPR